MFPYEHPSPVATTFDVTFRLPDVSLVAHAGRDPAAVRADEVHAQGAVGARGGGDGGDCAGERVEVGKVRSTLLTWRMRRFVAFFFSCTADVHE